MERLGPFEPRPALAAAVSGGADSTALALLAQAWVAPRGGSLLALVVDHGLRPDSGAEAALTLARLAARGIPGRLLALQGLERGPGLAARARVARHAALARACAEAGLLHLLLGHHALDQAETLRMRADAGSGAAGLAGMAALMEGEAVRLLRPLLGEPPARLRAFLRAECVEWVEDPSNADPATLRARLRADLVGDAAAVANLLAGAHTRGAARTAAEHAVAAELARHVRLHPEGWAVLPPGLVSAPALAALLRTLAGRAYPVAADQVAALAAAPRAATLAGTRLLPAGRLGAPGEWLLLREAAAMAPPIPAAPGALWDGRFRLSPQARPAPGWQLGALGPDAVALRRLRPHWPAALLHTLPAIRDGDRVVAVPALGHPEPAACAALALRFAPAVPLAGAAFLPI
jgi:tRNA(Ile)-lysidine synthase